MRLFVLLAWLIVVACDGAADREVRFLQEAKSALETGNLAQAEAASRKALQINPDSFSALFNIGLIAELRSQWDEACSHYQRTYRDRPLDVGAALKLGRCLILGDRAEEALVLAGLVAALHPDNREARLVRSVALLRLDRFREARATATTATGAIDEVAVIIAAASHRAEGNLDSARSLLRQTVAEGELTSFPQLYRLNDLLQSEDYRLAADYLREVVRAHPHLNKPVIEAGLNYLAGRHGNAVRALSRARPADPTDAIQQYELLELLSRDPRMAVHWTGEVSPDSNEFSFQLWPVFLSLKRLSKKNIVDAERLAERLLEAEIDDGTAQIVHLQLADLQFARGENERSTESVLQFAKGFTARSSEGNSLNPRSLPGVLYPADRECSASLQACVSALVERNIRALMLGIDPWLTYALDLAAAPPAARSFGQEPANPTQPLVPSNSPDFPRFANEIVLSAMQQRTNNADFGWTTSNSDRWSDILPYALAAVLIGLISMLLIGPFDRTRRRIK